MTRMMYNWIMRRKLNPREDVNGGISNFTGRIKGMHVFIGNFTYVVDFMIVEDISSIIDPRLSQVVLGRPFIKNSHMTHDLPEGVVRFTNGDDEVAYKMPYKIEQYNSLLNLEKEHKKSVYLRNDEDKRRGVDYVMNFMQVEQDKQVLKRLVYLLESHLFGIYRFSELAKVLATWCSELGSKSSELEQRVSVASYRYIDTKPNNELIHYCLQNPPYKFKWTEKTIPGAEGSSKTTTEGYMENYKNVSQDIRDQLNAEAEVVQIILTGIDNDIYSTVDACPNVCEMRKAI
ncbi:retrotransposon ORF1, partial [Tanacetum coccineum]